MPQIQEFTHSSQFNSRLEELRNIDEDIVLLEVDLEEGRINEETYNTMSCKMAENYAFASRERDCLGW